MYHVLFRAGLLKKNRQRRAICFLQLRLIDSLRRVYYLEELTIALNVRTKEFHDAPIKWKLLLFAK